MAPEPIAPPILAGLKEFQHKTVEYVFRRLYTDPDAVHRFLVADEVGLGKTADPMARGGSSPTGWRSSSTSAARSTSCATV